MYFPALNAEFIHLHVVDPWRQRIELKARVGRKEKNMRFKTREKLAARNKIRGRREDQTKRRWKHRI